jgi:hypothetical protein
MLKQNDGKKPYEKPRLRLIELAAEEVMVVGCKQLLGAGGSGDPTTCIQGALGPCQGSGS